MSLLEYLDRTGRQVNSKTFEKYKNENHNYSEWEALTSFSTNKGECI